jgi:hypothetical protein
MAFNKKSCAIPTVWCGDGKMPTAHKDGMFYTREGTRSECVKKGFGAGKYQERNAHLPKTSLLQIKYVGETYEGKFKRYGITSTTQLLKEFKSSKANPSMIEKTLKDIFTKKDHKLDQRAYNSTLLYLYGNGIGKLPQCSKMI